MSNRKFRVGIIGAGGIFRWAHAGGWKNLPDAKMVAGCDVNEKTAATAAREYNIPKVFTEYRDLVILDLDAVDICTPNRVHPLPSVAALL